MLAAAPSWPTTYQTLAPLLNGVHLVAHNRGVRRAHAAAKLPEAPFDATLPPGLAVHHGDGHTAQQGHWPALELAMAPTGVPANPLPHYRHRAWATPAHAASWALASSRPVRY